MMFRPHLYPLFSHLQKSETFAVSFEIRVTNAMRLCMITVVKNIDPLFFG